MRWCKGAVADRILSPLVQRIEEGGGAVLGGRRVKEVMASNGTKLNQVVAMASDGALEVRAIS